MAGPASVTAVFVGDTGGVSLSGLSTRRSVQSPTTDPGVIKRTEKPDNTLPQIFPLQNNEVTPARLWCHHADKEYWTTPFLFSFLLLHHLHCTLSGAITGQTQWHSGKQHSCKKLSIFKRNTFFRSTKCPDYKDVVDKEVKKKVFMLDVVHNYFSGTPWFWRTGSDVQLIMAKLDEVGFWLFFDIMNLIFVLFKNWSEISRLLETNTTLLFLVSVSFFRQVWPDDLFLHRQLLWQRYWSEAP